MVAFRGCAQSYPTFVDTDAAPSQKRGLLFETVRRYPTPSNFAKGAAHGPEFPRTACGVLTVRLYRMFPPTSFAHKLIISTLSVPQPAMRQDVGLQPNLSRNHRENALGPENPSRYATSDRDRPRSLTWRCAKSARTQHHNPRCRNCHHDATDNGWSRILGDEGADPR